VPCPHRVPPSDIAAHSSRGARVVALLRKRPKLGDTPRRRCRVCALRGMNLLVGELVVRVRIYGPLTGTQGLLGERRLGRPVFARWAVSPTFRWPPLRLARLCCEHESVGVVCPPVLLSLTRRREMG
jgi:hypothetical protein